ncbi:hypothetical protein PSE_4632 [Pseudovibrio sp. FO-BEG1]|uniref:hypothetical protein n=1 Tax=Pseudovibrio sp. (strain FO-BEG1) TaxID=911045 RepID=UPI000238CBC6|nr:hypothetical protein [Pseudovibrio sp. FO-BEG1]AEV39134.1 hypothetical protein PSE_4632 [Pseudovibrio sp. FO-BEG1]
MPVTSATSTPQVPESIHPTTTTPAAAKADAKLPSYSERHLNNLGINVKFNADLANQKSENALKAVSIHRVVNNEVAVTTNALHNIVPPGSDVVITRSAPHISPASPSQTTEGTHRSVAKSDVPLSSIPQSAFSVIDGTWHDAHTINIVAPGNVFGASGCLSCSEVLLEIPMVTELSPAFEDVTRAFGIKVFGEGETVPVKFDKCDLNVVEYKITPANHQYSLQEANGFFVERHEFPHIFMPSSDQDEIIITVGKQVAENQFAMANIKVPEGKAIMLPGDTIHTDSLSRGNIVIMLTECVGADTVLMHDKDSQPITLRVDSSERIGLAEWHV